MAMVPPAPGTEAVATPPAPTATPQPTIQVTTQAERSNTGMGMLLGALVAVLAVIIIFLIVNNGDDSTEEEPTTTVEAPTTDTTEG